MDPPRKGEIIQHRFIWEREARAGLEEGKKLRRCIVVGIQPLSKNEYLINLIPITHTPQRQDPARIRVSREDAQAMKLDERQSWVVTDEMNTVRWPPAGEARKEHHSYGVFVPEGMRESVRAQIRENSSERRQQRVDLSDPWWAKRQARVRRLKSFLAPGLEQDRSRKRERER